jgi:hypothetical protein
VLVGIKPNRMRFTVHRDLITKRSEFFRAARSKCWTEPSKVIRLVDDDPVVFEAYLHCLYFGSDSFGEPIPDNDKDKEVEKQHAEHHESARFLIDLYLVADRYLDPTAANVVMRGLVTFVHSRPWNPSEATIAKVYARTTEGNPLQAQQEAAVHREKQASQFATRKGQASRNATRTALGVYLFTFDQYEMTH